MIPIQILGVAVGLTAIYLTYLYYRRANFTKKELYLWLAIWLSFVLVAIFPRIVQPVVGVLGLNRRMDLIMIVAFMVLFSITFHTYIVSRRQERKLARLVQKLALKDLNDNQ